MCLYNIGMNTVNLSLEQKLQILAAAAKYDVACTSGGVEKKGKKGFLGNARPSGICHSFSSDGRCISLLKILMSNHCIFDCKYCANRSSNDIQRCSFSPEEIAKLTMEFYTRNYIEGLFLSSGILKSPAYTMEKICETLSLLRNRYHFRGYIHAKAIPGAPEELIACAGYLADRISINLEISDEKGLKKLAPHKNFHNILQPMKKISNMISLDRLEKGKNARIERSQVNTSLPRGIFSENKGGKKPPSEIDFNSSLPSLQSPLPPPPSSLMRSGKKFAFAPAGQSTQMIIGAGGESDYSIIKASQNLYTGYDLKRVFYSAYIPLNQDAALPPLDTPPPLLREHRLYQADWLLRFYGFRADELLSPEEPNFNELFDPKCNWALRNLSLFPIELEKAPLDMLLRIPGIGPKSAYRILASRRYGKLTFESLAKMGVVLKRARYFITCQGKMMYKIPIEKEYIGSRLIMDSRKEYYDITHPDIHRQLSLFQDFGLNRLA